MATKEFKGTKGNWKVDENCSDIFWSEINVVSDDYGSVCSMSDNWSIWNSEKNYSAANYAVEEAQANAKLIASAPKLLEALQEALELLEEHQPNWYLRKHYNKFESAISSALEG